MRNRDRADPDKTSCLTATANSDGSSPDPPESERRQYSDPGAGAT